MISHSTIEGQAHNKNSEELQSSWIEFLNSYESNQNDHGNDWITSRFKEFIEQNVDLTIPNAAGLTIFLLALLKPYNHEVVDILLEKGVELDVCHIFSLPNEEKWRVLRYCVGKNLQLKKFSSQDIQKVLSEAMDDHKWKIIDYLFSQGKAIDPHFDSNMNESLLLLAKHYQDIAGQATSRTERDYYYFQAQKSLKLVRANLSSHTIPDKIWSKYKDRMPYVTEGKQLINDIETLWQELRGYGIACKLERNGYLGNITALKDGIKKAETAKNDKINYEFFWVFIRLCIHRSELIGLKHARMEYKISKMDLHNTSEIQIEKLIYTLREEKGNVKENAERKSALEFALFYLSKERELNKQRLEKGELNDYTQAYTRLHDKIKSELGAEIKNAKASWQECKRKLVPNEIDKTFQRQIDSIDQGIDQHTLPQLINQIKLVKYLNDEYLLKKGKDPEERDATRIEYNNTLVIVNAIDSFFDQCNELVKKIRIATLKTTISLSRVFDSEEREKELKKLTEGYKLTISGSMVFKHEKRIKVRKKLTEVYSTIEPDYSNLEDRLAAWLFCQMDFIKVAYKSDHPSSQSMLKIAEKIYGLLKETKRVRWENNKKKFLAFDSPEIAQALKQLTEMIPSLLAAYETLQNSKGYEKKLIKYHKKLKEDYQAEYKNLQEIFKQESDIVGIPEKEDEDYLASNLKHIDAKMQVGNVYVLVDKCYTKIKNHKSSVVNFDPENTPSIVKLEHLQDKVKEKEKSKIKEIEEITNIRDSHLGTTIRHVVYRNDIITKVNFLNHTAWQLGYLLQYAESGFSPDFFSNVPANPPQAYTEFDIPKQDTPLTELMRLRKKYSESIYEFDNTYLKKIASLILKIDGVLNKAFFATLFEKINTKLNNDIKAFEAKPHSDLFYAQLAILKNKKAEIEGKKSQPKKRCEAVESLDGSIDTEEEEITSAVKAKTKKSVKPKKTDKKDYQFSLESNLREHLAYIKTSTDMELPKNHQQRKIYVTEKDELQVYKDELQIYQNGINGIFTLFADLQKLAAWPEDDLNLKQQMPPAQFVIPPSVQVVNVEDKPRINDPMLSITPTKVDKSATNNSSVEKPKDETDEMPVDLGSKNKESDDIFEPVSLTEALPAPLSTNHSLPPTTNTDKFGADGVLEEKLEKKSVSELSVVQLVTEVNEEVPDTLSSSEEVLPYVGESNTTITISPRESITNEIPITDVDEEASDAVASPEEVPSYVDESNANHQSFERHATKVEEENSVNLNSRQLFSEMSYEEIVEVNLLHEELLPPSDSNFINQLEESEEESSVELNAAQLNSQAADEAISKHVLKEEKEDRWNDELSATKKEDDDWDDEFSWDDDEEVVKKNKNSSKNTLSLPEVYQTRSTILPPPPNSSTQNNRLFSLPPLFPIKYAPCTLPDVGSENPRPSPVLVIEKDKVKKQETPDVPPLSPPPVLTASEAKKANDHVPKVSVRDRVLPHWNKLLKPPINVAKLENERDNLQAKIALFERESRRKSAIHDFIARCQKELLAPLNKNLQKEKGPKPKPSNWIVWKTKVWTRLADSKVGKFFSIKRPELPKNPFDDPNYLRAEWEKLVKSRWVLEMINKFNQSDAEIVIEKKRLSAITEEDIGEMVGKDSENVNRIFQSIFKEHALSNFLTLNIANSFKREEAAFNLSLADLRLAECCIEEVKEQHEKYDKIITKRNTIPQTLNRPFHMTTPTIANNPNAFLSAKPVPAAKKEEERFGSRLSLR